MTKPTRFKRKIDTATIQFSTVPAEPPAEGSLFIRVGRQKGAISLYYDITLPAADVMALYGFLKRAIYEGEFL